jgi:glucose/arabinose dehydrogenase
MSRRLSPTVAGLAVVAVLVAACSGGGGRHRARGSTGPSGSTAASSAPGTTASGGGDLNAARVKLTPVAELEAATSMTVRAGDTALYVAEQAGRVRAVRDGGLDPRPVLDIRNRTMNSGEEGLLGLAFSRDGSKLYVHYSDSTHGGDNQLDEYEMRGGVADPSTRRPILTVATLQPNHNGGQLAFGPDGHLYIGLGDGGAAGDQGPGHAAGGNGQSRDTLLGKMLRIDPSPSGPKPYSIPADNPFAKGGGKPEIWAYGLRNPWRFSFDRETRDLWIADVGQNAWEEVDFVPAGQGAGFNFGWNRLEGNHRFAGDPPAGAKPPIYEYSHDNGDCSITGGFVYRGGKIPNLRGAYVFSDYCNGAIRALVQRGGKVTTERDLGVKANDVASFGQDADGELYVLSQSTGLLRIDPA